MKCTIEIEMGNAAFFDQGEESSEARGYELARILRELAGKVEDGISLTSLRVFDVNGNKVGHITVSEE